MTTYFSAQTQCVACGNDVVITCLGSTHSLGAPDLDLRPPEMTRSTMHAWVQECPDCGYCADEIDAARSVAASAVKTAEYGLARKEGGAASRFQRWFLVADAAGLPEAAAQALVWSAWACDDEGDPIKAKGFRISAAERYETLILDSGSAASGSGTAGPNEMTALVADLWRRAGQWDAARKAAERGIAAGVDGDFLAVLKFQMHLVSLRDSGPYNLDQACAWRGGL